MAKGIFKFGDIFLDNDPRWRRWKRKRYLRVEQNCYALGLVCCLSWWSDKPACQRHVWISPERLSSNAYRKLSRAEAREVIVG